MVSRLATAWLENHGEQPFFLFLHYYDLHLPYDPPPSFPSTYAGEIAYVDACIGKVMDKLRALGLYDNTLVVVVGDHGEGLGDHGETEHGFFIYQNTLHVPLIVRLPNGGLRGGRIDENVSLIDVMPTVLGLLGRPIPEQVEGVDLSGDVAGSRGRIDRGCSTASRCRRNSTAATPCTACWTVPGSTCSPDKPELYDLGRDGGEKVNLVDKEPQIARRLRGRLEERRRRWHRRGTARKQAAGVPLGQDTLRQLESLGYVGGGTARGSGFGPRAGRPQGFCGGLRTLQGGMQFVGEASLRGGQEGDSRRRSRSALDLSWPATGWERSPWKNLVPPRQSGNCRRLCRF